MNSFEKKIKDKLKYSEIQPPEASWESISDELHKSERKPFYFSYWLSSAAACVLFLLGIYWFLSKENKSISSEIQSTDKIVLEEKSNKQSQSENIAKNQFDNYDVDNGQKKLRLENNSKIIFMPKENSIYQKNIEEVIAIRPKSKDKLENIVAKNQKNITEQDLVVPKEINEKIISVKDVNKNNVIGEKTSMKNDEDLLEIAGLGDDKKNSSIEEKSSTRLKNKISISGFAGNWDVFKNNPNMIGENVDSFDTDSNKSMEYGVLVSYKITPKISISSGVGIFQLKQTSAGIAVRTDYISETKMEINVIPSYKKPNSDEVILSSEPVFYARSMSIDRHDMGEIQQQIRFFQIPLEISYELISIGSKWNWSLLGGTNFYVLNQKNFTLTYIRKHKNVNYLNASPDYSFSLKMGTNLSYQLKKDIKVFIQPEVMQLLSTLGKEENKPNIGVKTGISIGL